jgi:multidrug efflux system membrane fusion protein
VVKAFATPAGADAAPITGVLSFVDNGVDTTTGTVTLKARFQNEDNRLWPGQFVPVGLELFVEKDALLVPTIAVQTGQEGTFIYGIDGEKKAQMHAVTVARQVGDKSVITKGLEAGETIVVDGQSRLAVGSVVEVLVPGAKPEAKKGAPK